MLDDMLIHFLSILKAGWRDLSKEGWRRESGGQGQWEKGEKRKASQ